MRSFRSQSSWMWIILVLLLFYSSARCATGEEPTKDGCWVVEQDEQTGRDVRTMEMTLHPAGEPLPSLKYRLLPDDFDMVNGNAAIYYLKAMGFLEQTVAPIGSAKCLLNFTNVLV